MFAKPWIKGLSKDHMADKSDPGRTWCRFLAPGSSAVLTLALKLPNLHCSIAASSTLAVHLDLHKMAETKEIAVVEIHYSCFMDVTLARMSILVQCYKL